MSADNYYEVKIHPLGGFTYVLGFDSDLPPARMAMTNDIQFSDVWEAWKHAANTSPAYAVIFHPECEQALRDYWGPSTTTL